jgi:protein-disulfide isomerase
MNKRLWIVFTVLVLLTVSGLAIWKKGDSGDVDIEGLDAQRLLTLDDVGEGNIPDHYIGNTEAKVIVIEYADFACIHCAQSSSTFSKIVADYQDRILFIHRNFSLNHPNSPITQSAAEAAFLLGGSEAYWTMHELLYKDESTWTGQSVPQNQREELLGDFAKGIGLDVDEFLKAIKSYRDNGIISKMKRDKKLGESVGVTGTPAWFVNGEKVDDLLTDSNIRKVIDEALKSTEEKAS